VKKEIIAFLPIFLDAWSMCFIGASRCIITSSVSKIKVYLIIQVLFTTIHLLIFLAFYKLLVCFLSVYLGRRGGLDLDLWDRFLLRGNIIGVPETVYQREIQV
jgi:hypothetical protein